MNGFVDKKEMTRRLGSVKLVKRLLFHWLSPAITGRGKRRTLVARSEFDRACCLVARGHLPPQLPSDGGPARSGWPDLDLSANAAITREIERAERLRAAYDGLSPFNPDAMPTRPQESPMVHWLLEAASLVQTVAVPIERILVDSSRFQWKSVTPKLASSGTNEGDRLGGIFSQAMAGSLICYEEDQLLFVIDGHHRLDLARRSGAGWIYARCLPSATFSPNDALVLGIITNISDGHGRLQDQLSALTIIRSLGYGDSHDVAPYLRNRGSTALTLYTQASQDLVDLVINGALSSAKAVCIAEEAPNQPLLQRMAVREALAHPQLHPEILRLHVRQMARMVKTKQDATIATADLWEPDEAWLEASRDAAQKVDGLRRRIDDRLRAVRGAAANPKAAASLGVYVGSPEKTQDGINRLVQLKEKLANWRTSMAVVREVEKELDTLGASPSLLGPCSLQAPQDSSDDHGMTSKSTDVPSAAVSM